MTCFSLKMIKFLDQVLLLLLVKTVMGHKNVVVISSFGFFFLAGFSLQNVNCMPFKRTGAGLWSQRSGGFHCLKNPHGTLSSPGKTGSWGLLHKRSLWSSGCCQEARQRGIKHP